MKQLIIALFAALLIPTSVLAAQFQTNEERAIVEAGTTVRDDLYIASGTVAVDGTVQGDLIVAGGQVRVTGQVTGDVIAAGGDVEISGRVTDDVRVAGGSIRINGEIGDDLFITGGSVEIETRAKVTGEVYIGAGSVVIGGTTGAVKAGVGELRVTESANINGNLTYQSEKRATIEDGAVITGVTSFKAMQGRDRGSIAGVVSVGMLLSLLITFLLAWLFLVLAPNKTLKLTDNWRLELGNNLLTGFLFLVATPIAIIILFATLVGIPIALILIFVYAVLLFLAKLVSVLVIGSWLESGINKDGPRRLTWLSAALGAIAVAVIMIIPFIGWAAYFIILLISLGALVRYDWRLLQQLRKTKAL